VRQPTEEELKGFTPALQDRYKDMLERMKTVAWALLSEYPRAERVLACNALVGVGLGALSAGIGLTDEESDAFTQEHQTTVWKWVTYAAEQHPELFEGGLPEPMQRPEGS
jgi:hypothetical protein